MAPKTANSVSAFYVLFFILYGISVTAIRYGPILLPATVREVTLRSSNNQPKQTSKTNFLLSACAGTVI